MNDARIIEGGEEARVKLTAALRKFVEGPDTDGDIEITLYQAAKMGEMAIREFIYDFDGGLDELVKEIINEAEDDAESHRGKVKYAVRVKGRPFRTIFTLHVPTVESLDDDDDVDELPNRRGLIAQQMKHNEIFAKEMLAGSRTDRTFMYNMIRDLQQENQQLKKQWFEGQAIIENLRNMQFARDLELQKLQKSEERKDKVATMLMQTGPMLASRLLGGGTQAAVQAEEAGAPAGNRTPLEAMLEGLFSSLEQKPEKLQQIANLLDPVELANLAEIHRYIAERREKEEELKQSAQQEPSNGVAPMPPRPYTPYVPPTINGASLHD
jgi:hypothetical protein